MENNTIQWVAQDDGQLASRTYYTILLTNPKDQGSTTVVYLYNHDGQYFTLFKDLTDIAAFMHGQLDNDFQPLASFDAPDNVDKVDEFDEFAEVDTFLETYDF